MKRYKSSRKLIANVDTTIAALEVEYELARADDTVIEIMVVEIKNAMENLRSCLDFCAQDVKDFHCSARSGDTYFPYSSIESDFKGRVQKSFPGLATERPTIFKLFHDMQPFASGDDWLSFFCRINNHNKHDNLSEQKREHIPPEVKLSTQGINLVRASGYSSGKIGKLVVNGKVVGTNVVIDTMMSEEELQRQMPSIDVKKTGGTMRFTLDGTDRDALNVLCLARDKIDQLVEALQIELSSV
jgi:hypothetical protein